MKNSIKHVLRLGIAGALSLLLILQSDLSSASSNNYPPIRIGLRYGYYGGYYRPVFPSYYGWGYPRIGFSIGVLPFGYIPFYYGGVPYYAYDGVYYRPYNNGYQVVVPPVGAEVPQVPSHARPITINGMQYYTLNGVYYKPETKADGTIAFVIAGKDGTLNTSITGPVEPPAQTPPPANNSAPAPAAPPVNYSPVPLAPPVTEPVPTTQQPLAPVAADAKVGDTVLQLPDGCKSVNVAGKTYFLSPGDVYYEQVVNGQSISYRVQGVPTSKQ